MIRELEERTGGGWRPSAGSIYPTLQLLEDEGMVEATHDTAATPGKRSYILTDAGRAEVARSGAAPWEAFADSEASEWHELRDAGMGLLTAAMQGAQAANEDQLHRITDTLREARSRIYRILGEDESREPADADDSESPDDARDDG